MPPSRKWEPYDPQRWAGTDFGMGSATDVVDVDMDAEGPEGSGGHGASAGHGGLGAEGAPASASSTNGGAGEEHAGAGPASPMAKPKPKQKQRKKVTVEDEEDGEERHIATGAITRVRRRRKEWARRGAEDVGPTYNLHLGPNGTQHRDIPGILLG